MASGNPYLDDAPSSAPSGSNPYLDDTPAPAAAPAKEWGFREYATEGLRAIGTGASKAVTSTAGLPADILRLGQAGLDYSQSVGQGRPYADVSAENQASAPGVSRALQAAGSENLQSFVPISPPETRVGKLAAEGIHFAGQAAALPFGGASALGRAVGAGGAVAGVASEAAGQLTEGTAAEPYARLAGALVPTGVSAIAQAPSAAQRAAVGAAREIPQAEINQILDGAQRLLDDAAANGTKLSTFQAVDQASGGRVNLSELQRHAEGMGRLRSFFADIGDRNRDAAGRQFRGVAPDRADVSAVGAEVGAAARAGVAATPEGQVLSEAQAALGPRVEAREAGEAMQAGLTQTYDRREGMRAALAEGDYDAARNAPERIGVDRYIDVERPGDLGLVTREGDAPARARFTTDGPQLDPQARAGAADGPRPVSLARFVAMNGGVELRGGEAVAGDLHRYNIPGVGKVARPDGKSIDSFWREKLTGPDGYFAGETGDDITNRLISALEEERAGRPVFRPQDQQAAERQGLTRSREADELGAARSQAEADLARDAEAAGLRPQDMTPEARKRAVDYLAGGSERDPLAAYERAVSELETPPGRRPATTEERGPNVTEQVYAPRFGQVNPTAALRHIDEAITNAKGDQLTALRRARRTLFDANGELDLTSEGNMAAARAIQSVADKAAAGGDKTTALFMGRAKDALKGAMETTPEIATANRTFESASRNLDNFDASRPAGKIVERDRTSGRPTLDPEQVPGQIRGSTAAREFNELAPTEARQAYQGRLTTEVMDAAGGENASGEAIRAQITRDYDRLREHPEVLARLNALAEADEGLAVVRASPLGQLAERNPTTKEAVNALFQRGEAAQSVGSEEVGRAVSALVATNPRAAAQLVRIKIEGAFNSVAKDVNTAGGQMGAAKFRNALMGNTKEAADLRAAVRALPDGETVMAGLDRLFDVFQAQGLRQNVGSKTAYNQLFIEEASKGGNIEGVAKAAVNPIKLPSRFGKMIEEWRLGRNMDQIAAMATDPNARAAFRGLLKSGDISGPVGRLATIAARSQSSPALQIRVQPTSQDR